MRETGRYGVEAYLKKQVLEAGGSTRKFASRTNNPDQLVIWPCDARRWLAATIHFAELKAPGKKPRPGQAREHKRLRDMGCMVFVLDTKPKIDEYVAKYK